MDIFQPGWLQPAAHIRRGGALSQNGRHTKREPHVTQMQIQTKTVQVRHPDY